MYTRIPIGGSRSILVYTFVVNGGFWANSRFLAWTKGIRQTKNNGKFYSIPHLFTTYTHYVIRKLHTFKLRIRNPIPLWTPKWEISPLFRYYGVRRWPFTKWPEKFSYFFPFEVHKRVLKKRKKACVTGKGKKDSVFGWALIDLKGDIFSE